MQKAHERFIFEFSETQVELANLPNLPNCPAEFAKFCQN